MSCGVSGWRNNPWFILVVPSLILLTLSWFGLQRMQLNGDARVFLDRKSDEFHRVLSLEEEFVANDTIMFVVEASNGSMISNTHLRAIEFLTEWIWKQSRVQRVDSITNFQYTVSDDESLTTSDLFDSDRVLDVEMLEQYVRSEPRLLNYLVGPDLDVTGVVATLNIDRSDQQQVAEVNAWAQALMSRFNKQFPSLKCSLAGSAVYAHALTSATKAEFSTKIPLILLILVVILYVVVRSGWLILAILYLILLCNVVTLGLAGWFGVPITPIIAFVPISLFAIVLADAVHFISGYVFHLKRVGDRKSAIINSIADNFQAMLITSVTTAIGFLCLNMSDSPPYRHLGNLAAVGSLIAFVMTAVWLPKWIRLCPVKPIVAEGDSSLLLLGLKRPGLSIGLVALGVVCTWTQLPGNYLDERIDRFFDDSWEVKKANTLVNQKLTGVHRLELRVPVIDESGITSVQYLEALSRFESWASALPTVAHVASFDMVMKTLNQQLNGGDPRSYVLPSSSELASQYLLLYELSLPFGSNLEDLMNFDKSATRIKVLLYSTSSTEIIRFRQMAENWMAENWPVTMQTPTISLEAAFSALNIENSRSLLVGTALGIVLIAFVLTVALRSVSLGLVSIFSNMIPAVTAFGIWGVMDGQVGLAVSMVAVITLGIVVDDTIHLLSKYQRATQKLGMDAERSALYAISTTGRALFTTTLVLCVCFGLLSFSHFKPNADLGIMSAVTLFVALIVDLYLLMPFIVLVNGRRLCATRIVLQRRS